MSHGELTIGMLVHFLVGQLSTTQQIADTQAVIASCCARQGGQVQISGNRRKETVQGLEHFILPFLLLTETGHVYSGSRFVLSKFQLVKSLLYHSLLSSCAIPVRFTS